jgi:hypothetical protein
MASCLLIEHGILSGARKIRDGLVIDIRHIDRLEVSGPIELGQAHGISAVGLNPVSGFSGYERRSDHIA